MLERERYAADWEKQGVSRQKALSRFRTEKKVQPLQERRFFRKVVYYYENLPEHGEIQKTKGRKSLGSGRSDTTLTTRMKEYFSCLVECCRGPAPALVKQKAKLNKHVLGLAQNGLQENKRKRKRDELDTIFEEPQPQAEPKEVIDLTEEETVLSKSAVPVEESTRPKKRKRVDAVQQSGTKASPLKLDESERSKPPESMKATVVSEAPEFNWTEAFLLLESKRDGSPVKLTYRQLVLQIKMNWPVEYKKRTLGAWYQAVRRWCLKNGLVLRKTNHSSPAKPSVVASEIRLFRKEFKEAIEEDNLQPFQICNLDETSIQIFTEMVETLHYKGAKRVPGEKTDKSRVYLNVSAIWWADGRVDFVVLYRSDAQAVKEKPEWEKLGKGSGVYWLKAASKWTTKTVYPEVVRALVKMGCKLFSDDHAPSHLGTAVDHFLRSIGARRIQVPRNATSLAQPGDRPGCNQALKRILNETLLDMKLRALLEQQFEGTKIKASLNHESRVTISNVLVQVRDRMNKEHAEDIRKSFLECCLPNGKMHSVLEEFLEKNPEPQLPPATTIPDNAFVCLNGCGSWWKKKSSQTKHHETFCWSRRPRLCTPVPRRSVKKLNAPWFPGLVGRVYQFKRGEAPKPFDIFLGDSFHYNMASGKPVWIPSYKGTPWWWKYGKVLWREATPQEKELAKERKWLA